MIPERVRKILEVVAQEKRSVDSALEEMRSAAVCDLGFSPIKSYNTSSREDQNSISSPV